MASPSSEELLARARAAADPAAVDAARGVGGTPAPAGGGDPASTPAPSPAPAGGAAAPPPTADASTAAILTTLVGAVTDLTKEVKKGRNGDGDDRDESDGPLTAEAKREKKRDQETAAALGAAFHAVIENRREAAAARKREADQNALGRMMMGMADAFAEGDAAKVAGVFSSLGIETTVMPATAGAIPAIVPTRPGDAARTLTSDDLDTLFELGGTIEDKGQVTKSALAGAIKHSSHGLKLVPHSGKYKLEKRGKIDRLNKSFGAID
jgi:hypothetical protein